MNKWNMSKGAFVNQYKLIAIYILFTIFYIININRGNYD